MRSSQTGLLDGALVLPLILAALVATSPDRAAQADERVPGRSCVLRNGGGQAFPRAELRIVNQSDRAMTVTLQPRPIARSASANFAIAPQSSQRIPHALPAGRNVLTIAPAAAGTRARTFERVIYVANHGERTCGRHYLLRLR